MVPCAERRGETDNRATTPFGYCPSTVCLHVWPHCANARQNRCQEDLNGCPLVLENWRRPPGCPRTTWMKTIQQDLKSNNLSLNEAIVVTQNRPLWRLMSTFWHYALPVVHVTKEEEEIILPAYSVVTLLVQAVCVLLVGLCSIVIMIRIYRRVVLAIAVDH